MGYTSMFFCDDCGKQAMDTESSSHICKKDDIEAYKIILERKKTKNK